MVPYGAAGSCRPRAFEAQCWQLGSIYGYMRLILASGSKSEDS